MTRNEEWMVDALFDAVQKRPRPEDVASLVLEALVNDPKLTPQGHAALLKAASRSARVLGQKFSSMAADFVRPTSGAARTLSVAGTMMLGSGCFPTLSADEAMDPERLKRYVTTISGVICKKYGESQAADKMTKEQRRSIGLFKNARWYNKRWRILCRLEKKIDRLIQNQRKYLFTRVSKSGLAIEITKEAMATDLRTACFIAYLSARQSLRSQFTNTSQIRAFDEVAEALLQVCEASPTTRWDLVAHVLPDERVLRHLSDAQKGQMLGRWWTLLVDMADMLQHIYLVQDFKRETMIVSRGNDSTTWNAVAAAWNKTREQWISVLYAMKMDGLLDSVCPGKVMRLMAADVASWHRSSGGDVHPDTKVWALLPPPWKVVIGVERCTYHMIQEACTAAGTKPGSWLGPKLDREPVPFTPTPELVHGVVVSSPELAKALRKAGVFSGKALKSVPPKADIQRDAHGAAIRVDPWAKTPITVARKEGRA